MREEEERKKGARRRSAGKGLGGGLVRDGRGFMFLFSSLFFITMLYMLPARQTVWIDPHPTSLRYFFILFATLDLTGISIGSPALDSAWLAHNTHVLPLRTSSSDGG